MKTFSYIETFDSWDDASTWLEGYLREVDLNGYEIFACSITLIADRYRAGIVYGDKYQDG